MTRRHSRDAWQDPEEQCFLALVFYVIPQVGILYNPGHVLRQDTHNELSPQLQLHQKWRHFLS